MRYMRVIACFCRYVVEFRHILRQAEAAALRQSGGVRTYELMMGGSAAGRSEVAGRLEHAFPVALAGVGTLQAQQVCKVNQQADRL